MLISSKVTDCKWNPFLLKRIVILFLCITVYTQAIAQKLGEEDNKWVFSKSQQSELDSLKAVISSNKKNTETVYALTTIGALYSLYNNNKGNNYLKSAIRLGQQINDLEGVAWAEEALAVNQSYIGNYSKAIEMLLKTLKTGEQLKKIPLQRACLLDLCYIYDDLEDYSKGFYYSDKAYHISKSKIIKSSCLHINGYFLCKMNRPDKALPYFEKELNIAKNLSIEIDVSIKNQQLGCAYTSFGLANSYKGNNETALNFFKKGEPYLLKGNYDAPLIENYYYTALTFKKMKEKDSSIFYYKKALQISSKINYLKGKLDCYKELADLYKDKNPIIAVHYFKLTEKLSDSLFNYRNKNEIQILTLNEEERQEKLALQEKKQKEQQIQLLLKEKKIAQEKRNLQLYTFITIILLLLLLLTVLYFAYKNKIETANKTKEINELKSRFFTNISHEFRTPLTLIKSPLQSLENVISDKKQLNQLSLIDKNANRMLELIDQLLEISKIESGNLKLILKEGNLGHFLTSIIEPFEFEAKENQLNFKYSIEKTLSSNYFDKDIIEKIVTNLLSNAFKYTPSNEPISFTSTIKNDALHLMVSNKNNELKKEDLSKLFERFYQKNENSKGVGIGLGLVKELVSIYKGSLETNIDNHILTFTISLPLEKNLINSIVIQEEKWIDEETAIDETANDSPILLVVDDNHDIRKVIASLFNDQFTILEAEDGEQALQMAQKEIPDCIISDVMMPKMNGYQLTNSIKTNPITSFVPVVLLTAKSSDESQLEGIKNYADAYITKPFNNEILKATVGNLINDRKKMHEHYKNGFILNSSIIEFNNSDKKFIEKVQKLLPISFPIPNLQLMILLMKLE
ncbi:MAG: hybrid sensor histidine kinase/response regulator [Flavobacterium sp.]|nr:hybrid sensor histidine kinase/response regulator [Flavobacterium sp.]